MFKLFYFLRSRTPPRIYVASCPPPPQLNLWASISKLGVENGAQFGPGGGGRYQFSSTMFYRGGLAGLFWLFCTLLELFLADFAVFD